MNTKDVDDFFAMDKTPEPPPEIEESPAPIVEPPPKRNGYKKQTVLPDLSFDSGLPAAVDAEKTLLGSVMLDNQALKEISSTINSEDFSLDSHRRIFHRMMELYEAGGAVDIVTLSNELAKNKEIDSIGGVAYLASLTEGLPRRPVIDEYIRICADKSLLRKMMLICSATIARAADQSEGAPEILAEMQTKLVELNDRIRLISLRKNPEPFFVGFRTFLASAPDNTEWTVEGLIQKEGNGLILGDSGTSKSLLVFDLALHLVAGVSWFHHRIPQRKKVGLVSREDAPGLSQSRLKRLREGAPEYLSMFLEGLDLEDWLYVHTRTQRETWTLQNEADIQEIIEAIKERGIQICFFDVFRVLWHGNENDNQETAFVLDAAKRIGRESNCQVCIVHHLSKSDIGTIFDRARGGGINGWKEWGMGLTVENPDAAPKDKIRKIEFHTKSACENDPIYYRLDGEDTTLTLSEVEPPTPQYNFRQSKKGKKEPEADRIPF
jgi:hypothetical protein